jgi:hypothetical protein
MITQLSEFFAKARVKVSRLSNKILLGSISGRLPFSSVRSLEEILHIKSIKNHVVDIMPIYEPNIVKYNFPKDYPPYFRRDKTFEKRCLFLLKDVYVSPASGMVWLSEGYILEESVGSLLRIMGWGGTLHEPLLPIKKLQDHHPIVACPPTGYFHWLFEIMPNILHILSRFPECKILLSTKSPKYLLDAIELLFGTKKYKTRIIFAQSPLRISNLIMPQIEVYSGFVHAKDIENLRTIFKGKVDTNGNIADNFLYISRKRSPKRKLSNEGDLENSLQNFGFKVIYAEELPFNEQVTSFSQAKIIIGPHGAGLSNMIWSNLPCEIFEIFAFNFFNDCYARLASTLGFGYDYIVCGQDKSSMGRIPIDIVLKKVKDMIEELNFQ